MGETYSFRLALTKADWDDRAGGWRCDALRIPGAKLVEISHGGREASPRHYSTDGPYVKWALPDHPTEILAKIELTQDLNAISSQRDELEQQKIRLEEEKLELERQKTKTANRWRWLTAAGATISFLAGLAVPILTGQPATKQAASGSARLVPEILPTKVAQLPSASADSDFDLLKDISVFDLRAWRPVTSDVEGTRHSPVSYVNYLHIKKKRSVDKYTAHYSTSGYAIDLRAITHEHKLLLAEKSEHPKEKSYAIEIDISREPVGHEFLVVLEGTYWNGFRDNSSEAAATYTDSDMTQSGELGILVLFPEEKRFKDYVLERKEPKEERYSRYREDSRSYASDDNRFIYWNISTRKANSHYRIRWNW